MLYLLDRQEGQYFAYHYSKSFFLNDDIILSPIDSEFFINFLKVDKTWL